jgi:hypothetical protein
LLSKCSANKQQTTKAEHTVTTAAVARPIAPKTRISELRQSPGEHLLRTYSNCSSHVFELRRYLVTIPKYADSFSQQEADNSEIIHKSITSCGHFGDRFPCRFIRKTLAISFNNFSKSNIASHNAVSGGEVRQYNGTPLPR